MGVPGTWQRCCNRRAAVVWLLALIACVPLGCAGRKPTAATDPFLQVPVTRTELAADTASPNSVNAPAPTGELSDRHSTAAGTPFAGEAPVVDDQPSAPEFETSPAGEAAVAEVASAVTQEGGSTHTADSRNRSASHVVPAGLAGDAAATIPASVTGAGTRSPQERAVTFSPAEPRTPIHTAARYSAQTEPVAPGAPGHNQYDQHANDHADEYIHDGGDRGLPIHYNAYQTLGVETEDTFAEFTDERGHRQVRPSNRVAVYAPRFAAVRSIGNASEGVAVRSAAAHDELTIGSALRNRTVVEDHYEAKRPGSLRMRSRGSGLETRTTRDAVDQAATLVEHVKLLNVYENLAFIHRGEMLQSERARLLAGMQAAEIWSRRQNPVIAVVADGVQEVYSALKAEEMVLAEPPTDRPGNLRIVKLADRKEAHSGDVITFTLRYDNLGDRPVSQVRIIDNLSPRLSYVPDSARFDRPARLTIDDNGEGSQLLILELKDPLPGQTGGVFTFQARVR